MPRGPGEAAVPGWCAGSLGASYHTQASCCFDRCRSQAGQPGGTPAGGYSCGRPNCHTHVLFHRVIALRHKSLSVRVKLQEAHPAVCMHRSGSCRTRHASSGRRPLLMCWATMLLMRMQQRSTCSCPQQVMHAHYLQCSACKFILLLQNCPTAYSKQILSTSSTDRTAMLGQAWPQNQRLAHCAFFTLHVYSSFQSFLRYVCLSCARRDFERLSVRWQAWR